MRSSLALTPLSTWFLLWAFCAGDVGAQLKWRKIFQKQGRARGIVVRHRIKAVEIFTLIGAKNDSGDQEFLERLEAYEAGFRKSLERNFTWRRPFFPVS